MCPRRKRPSSHEAAEPRPERRGRSGHEDTIKKIRVMFGKTWHECGEKKKNAQRDHRAEPVENQWLRMVTHKLFKRYHHLLSQLLKEVKQIKLHLD